MTSLLRKVVPIQSKTGHAFIKESMRREDAIYGGEMSAHHYFREFHYCDSGMIPWLLVTQLLMDTKQSLSDLVEERIGMYPCSGEVNFRVEDISATIQKVHAFYEQLNPVLDRMDGLCMTFPEWRINIRASNTSLVAGEY